MPSGRENGTNNNKNWKFVKPFVSAAEQWSLASLSLPLSSRLYEQIPESDEAFVLDWQLS